jgi:predicted dehydrogenase
MYNKPFKNRRGFLRDAALLATGFSIVPRHVLGKGYLAPSDQITKGIIGIGGMGRNHIAYAGTRVVAICDVDQTHLAVAAKMIGSGVKTFHNHEDLIALPEVDIVHIATPPHWHGLIATAAAKAGKDIWCEKPMTRTIGEGKRVVEAVKQYGRMVRLNTWLAEWFTARTR